MSKFCVLSVLSATIFLGVSPAVFSDTNEEAQPASQQNVADKETDLQTVKSIIIEGLKSREESINSINSCWTSIIRSNNDPELKKAIEHYEVSDADKKRVELAMSMPARVWHYTWIASDEKARFEVKAGVGLPKSSQDFINSYDGEKFKQWFVNSPIATEQINSGRWSEKGSSWFQVALGPKPYKLSEVLSDAQASVVIKETISGIQTVKLSVLRGNTRSSWWVAPSLNCLLVRSEVVSTRQSAPDEPISGWRYVTLLEKATKVGNIWLPSVVRSVKTISVRHAGSQQAVDMWQTVEEQAVLHVSVNQSISPRMFDILLPPGIEVAQSEEVGIGYKVTGTIQDYTERLKTAQLRGEQPDPSLCDASAVEEEARSGQFNPESVKDQVKTIVLVSNPG